MYIYAIDISVNSNNTVWVKIDQSGKLNNHGTDLNIMCTDLLQESENNKVALGFEAPMWIPMPLLEKDVKNEMIYKMKERFPQEKKAGTSNSQYQWYQGGAAPSIKSFVIGKMLFSGKESQFLSIATKDRRKWGTSDCQRRLFLFEGFAAGKYKPKTKLSAKLSNQHGLDAFSIASALLYELSSSSQFLKSASKHLKVECDINRDGVVAIETTTIKNKSSSLPLSEQHGGVICLWERLLNGNIPGPPGCDIYGYEF